MRGMEFSAALAKEIREVRGLSRRGVARDAGLSRQGLINIEDGVSVPGADTLGRLAHVYGVSLDDFFTHVEQPATAV